jgi:hypothetical protein
LGDGNSWRKRKQSLVTQTQTHKVKCLSGVLISLKDFNAPFKKE